MNEKSEDLLPIHNREFNGKTTSIQQNASLYKLERGSWNIFDKTFFGVPITHPIASLNMGKILEQLYREKILIKNFTTNEF